jgi:hypothetical protein
MRFAFYSGIGIILIVLLACAAGCTGTQNSGTATTSVQSTPAVTTLQAAGTSMTAAPKSADIETTIMVRFNDFACLNVQDALGSEYLYPDQKFDLWAAAPSGGGVNVNVLLVDENDQMKLRQIRPELDNVKKTWVYTGIVPVVQFNDIVTPQEKTFTIKTQSKYYICVDDRKESGASDVMYKVPVKLTRL